MIITQFLQFWSANMVHSAKAVYNAKVLEVVAEMDYHALTLTHQDVHLPQYLLDKHYYRKHGKDAYYGQDNAKSVGHAAKA